MPSQTEPSPERTELLLRSSRRALLVVLAMILLAAATLIAHAVRPGTLLADWPSKVPWLIPVAAALIFLLLNAPLGRRVQANSPEVRAMLEDEFRRTNLARAQRLTLTVVLIAQLPLALLLSALPSVAAVTVMAVASIAIGMATLITSFLIFDRE